MISYLIIDDEPIAHDIIKGYCDLLPNMQLMKNCYDALEAFDYLSKNKVDLIFLDLNMPVLKGFEFLKTLQNLPKVIVTTAYNEFALEGYEHNISDYLLKPFGFERFLKAVNKAIGSVDQKVVTNEKSEASNRIFVQSNKKHIQLETENILYIEATGNYIKIVTTTETITIREKFSTFLEQLPKNDFVQVHKSFAVAPKQINSVEGNIIFISNYQIPIGKLYKMNIVKLLK
ncbi:LytR/AlgR family response regulator transcription factor [Chryseobacterium balustinum]|uniref:Sensory transduction protein lytR n=1 Tax=Chryseobacterium balustinum TaxID=246 RepID=A0AAX2IL24_9FLAO|nr:response regulator transcription factor [Chryseobacterium balustinum]AZB29728.1 DNA-binding response regulator [Chryseobacterium balustinum]SKB91423.1 two component transcriptional regulator, LytTR family [Chryseobacterium balustinum]SQA90089.1 Sensory transduction protein lytR [Chryseobacterium balustinum]